MAGRLEDARATDAAHGGAAAAAARALTPPPLPTNFASRDAVLDELLCALTGRPPTTVVALQGEGGLGKTTLAAALVAVGGIGGGVDEADGACRRRDYGGEVGLFKRNTYHICAVSSLPD
jgi:hypothetical protein